MNMKLLSISILITGNLLYGGECSDWFEEISKGKNIAGMDVAIQKDSATGTWGKIFATGYGEYTFDKNSEKRRAQQKAMLRAKANLAKFMQEEITSKESLSDIANTMSDTSGDGQSQVTSATLKEVEAMTEEIHNSANALLKGIIVVCKSVDAATKEAEVIVAVSRNTMKQADNFKNGMNRNLDTENGSSSAQKSNSNTGKDSFKVNPNMDF